MSTSTASFVTQTSATLNGSVNPNGSGGTGWFEWGATNSYGNTTSVQNLGTGATSISVCAGISGLSPNTTYHFRAAAQNSTGSNYGTDQTFTTLASDLPVIAFTPANISFTMTQGGPSPTNQTITISNGGNGTLNWSVTSDQYWLTVNPQLGTNSGQVTLSISVVSLTVGSYGARVTIVGTGASNTPQSIPVSLVILPNGVFDISWQAKRDMPSGRYYAASVVYDNKLHVFGGDNGLTYFRYDPTTDAWSQLPNVVGNGIHNGGAAIIGSLFYMVDGVSGQLSIYDPVAAKWAIGPFVPTARLGATVLTTGSKLYVIGGMNTYANAISNVDVYDPNTNSWSSKAGMLTPRGYAAGAVVNNLLYVIGGMTDAGTGFATNLVEVYDPATNSWSAKNTMPTARSFPVATTLNNKIYAVGGETYNNVILRNVEEFDPGANTWRAASPLQVARLSPAVGTINGKLYVAGGYDGMNALSGLEEGAPTAQSPVINLNPSSLSFSTIQGNGNPPSETFVISNYGGGTLNWTLTKKQPWLSLSQASGTNTNTITVSVNTTGLSVGSYVDTVAVTAPGAISTPQRLPVTLNVLSTGYSDFVWQFGADIPTPKFSAASAVSGGKIHLIGGGNSNLQSHYVYDPGSNTWSTLASPPGMVEEGGAAELNGKIYVQNGFVNATGNILIYDSTSNSWSQGAAMHTSPRRFPGVVAVNGKVYVIGGGDIGLTPLNSVEEYDPTGDAWAVKTAMPTARYGAAIAVLNNLIYVIGGYGNQSDNPWTRVEVYDPSQDKWSSKPNILNTYRAYSGAVVVNNKIVLFGGDGGSSLQPLAPNVLLYDPATDTLSYASGFSWMKLSPLQTPRRTAAVAEVRGRVYVLGGQGLANGFVTYLSSVEVGTPATFSIAGQVSGVTTGSGDLVLTLVSEDLVFPLRTTCQIDAGGNYSFSGLIFGNYFVIPSKAGTSFNPPYKQILVSGANQSGQTFNGSVTAANTWETQTGGTFDNLSGVCFQDKNLGWAVGGSTVLHTTNGGATWSKQTLLSTDYYQLRSIAFADSLNGWAVDYFKGIIHTTDAGNTWSWQFKLPTPNASHVKICCVDKNTAWVSGAQGDIARTTNGGLSWSVSNLGSGYISSLNFINKFEGWLAKDDSILHTTDGGITWRPSYAGAQGYYVRSVAFCDTKNGWGVGSLGYYKILHTTNGGSFWAEETTAVKTDFWDLAVADSSLAFAVGNPPYNSSDAGIARTVDAGKGWLGQASGTPFGLTGTAFAENHLWAVGTNGTIIHSTIGVPRAPMVVTKGIDSLGLRSAFLVGDVNPNNLSTSAWFEYGTDSLLQNFQASSPVTVGNGSSNVRISAGLTGLNINAQYYCRIAAANSRGTKRGAVLAFRTGNAPPLTPALVAPLNGAADQPLVANLIWHPTTGSLSYSFQVSPDSSFNIISFTNSTPDTNQQVGPLSRRTTYYWRVNANNSAGSSPFSSAWRFTTGNGNGLNWKINLIASVDSLADNGAYAGVSDSASSGFDSTFDIPKPPRPPRNFVYVSFPHPEWKLATGADFNSDVRRDKDYSNQQEVWFFSIVTDQFNKSVRVTVLPDSSMPSNYRIFLKDLKTGLVQDVRQSNAYSYATGSDSSRTFQLVVGGSSLQNLTHRLTPGWNLFGIPLKSSSPNKASVFSSAIGPYLYSYSPNGGYASVDSFQIGRAYWAGALDSTNASLSGIQLLDTLNVPLASGFNLISSPYVYSYPVSDLWVRSNNTVYSLENAVARGMVMPMCYRYRNGSYSLADTLRSWEGYWFVAVKDSVQVIYEPKFGLSSSKRALLTVSKKGSAKAKVDGLTEFFIPIFAKAGNKVDSLGGFGASQNATSGFDAAFDFPHPPSPPAGESVELFFPHPEWKLSVGPRFSHDVRSLTDSLWWRFSVQSSPSQRVQLSWDSIKVMAILPFSLLDERTHTRTDMGKYGSYGFNSDSTLNFSIGVVVTSVQNPIGLPREFSLSQNYPNPFNPATIIEYAVPTKTRVAIVMYDLLGRQVQVLVDDVKEPGYYHTTFDARKLSSGIYFCRMAAGTFDSVKKLLLVR